MSQKQEDIEAVRAASKGVLVNASIDFVWCLFGFVPLMFCGAGLCLAVGGLLSLVHLYLGFALFKAADDEIGDGAVLLFSPLFSVLCLNPITAIIGFVRWSRVSDALERLEQGGDQNEPEAAPAKKSVKRKKKLGKKRIKALPHDVRSVFKGREDWLHIDEDADLVITALEDSNAPDRIDNIQLPLLEPALVERFIAIDFPRLRDLELRAPDESMLRILAKAPWLSALNQFEIRGEVQDVGDAVQTLAEKATGVRSLVMTGAWFEQIQWPYPLEFLQVVDATPDVLPLLPEVASLRLFGELEQAEWPSLQGLKEFTAYFQVSAALAQRLRQLTTLVELDTFIGPEVVAALDDMPALQRLELRSHATYDGIDACVLALAKAPLPNLQAIDLRLSLERWPAALLDSLASRPKLTDIRLRDTALDIEDLDRWDSSRGVVLDVMLKRRFALDVTGWRARHPSWSLCVKDDFGFDGEVPAETTSLDAPDFSFATTTGLPVWMDEAHGGGIVSQTKDGFVLAYQGSTSSSRVHGPVSDLAAVSPSQVALRVADGTVVLRTFVGGGNPQTIEVEAGRFFGDPERGRVLVDTGAGVIQFNRHGPTDFPSSIDLSNITALAPIAEAALWVQRETGELVRVDGDSLDPRGTGPLCQHLASSPDGMLVLGYGFAGLVLWGDEVAHLIDEPVVFASWQKRSDGFVVVYEHRIEVRLRTGELHATRSVPHESITCAVRCDDALVEVYTEDSSASVVLHEVLR